VDSYILWSTGIRFRGFIVVADSGLLNKTDVAPLQKAAYKYVPGARVKSERAEVKKWIPEQEKKNEGYCEHKRSDGERLILSYNGNNKIIDKSSLSMGERQMYASALLSSLVDESEIEFPVFIDSPMQKFDEEHAENIIRHFYPNVSKQVVIFLLINKELTKKEYEILQPKVCKAFLINNTSTDSSEFRETTPEQFITTYNDLYNAN
jgi:DNA sulfur modification protein DndD